VGCGGGGRTEENKEGIFHEEFYDSALNVSGDFSA
jgi:inner membrane protein involved in colicin E2 resistance